MKLYEKIQSDLKTSIKNKKRLNTSVLRVLISDIQRKNDKDYNNDYIIQVINKTLKFSSESKSDQAEKEQEILEQYLPAQISDDDIISYLKEIGIDKSNPMAAIGKVMKYFPNGSIKGKRVRDIIINLNN
jgi:uncharacterized protein YqeY